MTPAAVTGSPAIPDTGKGQRRLLLALPLITAVPILIFAIATVVYLTRQQQHTLERDIVQVARQSIQAADSLLNERLSTLDALSSLAAAGDVQGFSRQARYLLESRPDWHGVAVEDAQGTVVASETTPGAPPPLQIDDSALGHEPWPLAVVATSSNLGPFLLVRHAASDGAERMIVTAVFGLEPFSRALANQADPDWTVAVLDPRHVIAGRSRAPEQFVGAVATPSLVEEMEAVNENFFYAFNQEGQRVYTAFSTSSRSGWSAAIGAPAHLVEAPLERARWAWIGGASAAVVLAALLAWLLTRSIVERQAAESRALQLEAERQSEARLTDIAAHFPGVMYRRVLHPDGQISYPYLSGGIMNLFGDDALDRLAGPAALDRLAWNYVDAEDRLAVRNAIEASARDLAPYHVETRIKRPDGSLAWVRSMATTRPGSNGSVVWDGVILDVTELKKAEIALKEQAEVLETINRVAIQIASELDRDKLVQSVLDAGREVVGAEFGAFFYNLVNEAGESYTLYALSGARQEDFAGFPMPRNTAIFGPTFRGEGIVRHDDVTRDPRYGKNEPYHGMPEGHLPVRSYLATPVISRSGEVMGGLFFGHPEPAVFDDAAEQAIAGIAAQAAVALENAHLFKAAEDEIAQRRRAEEHQKMLLAELNHRVKNTLAVVLAIAHQTALTSTGIEHFSDVYRGRIMALANAHTLLTESNWRATSLRALLAKALEPYAGEGAERVAMSGPGVIVPPKQALALSLVFHELATNASKYGALSPEGGRLDIAWAPAEGDMVSLHWREHAHGPVCEPEREGFGSRLVTLNVTREIGGTVERHYAADGFRAELRLPWNPSTSEIVVRTAPRSSRSTG